MRCQRHAKGASIQWRLVEVNPTHLVIPIVCDVEIPLGSIQSQTTGIGKFCVEGGSVVASIYSHRSPQPALESWVELPGQRVDPASRASLTAKTLTVRRPTLSESRTPTVDCLVLMSDCVSYLYI